MEFKSHLLSHDAVGTVAKATPAKRKRGKALSRRTGQNGHIEASGKWFVVRFWKDIAGQEKRALARERICPISGPGSLNRSERERRAKEIIAESAVDTVAYFNRVVKQRPGVTFKEQASVFMHEVQTRKWKRPAAPSTVETWQGCLDKWWLADGGIGNLPLAEVNNETVKPVIEQMTAAALKPKTIRNYVQLAEMIVASLTDKDDNPIYPRNWSAKKMNLPAVEKREQNRPSFTGETVTALVAAAEDRIVQMLYILLAATGLRLGEALGISIENVLDGHTRIAINQKAWRNEIQTFLKTPNGDREVDLHPSVEAMLKALIGERTSGLLFQTKDGKPLCQTNLLKRHLHKALKAMGQPKAGFHAFRRFRNTYLRNHTATPDGLVKFWMGHAGKDMSDLYDKIRVDIGFRKKVAERAGIGFELPPFVPNVPNFTEQLEEEVLA